MKIIHSYSRSWKSCPSSYECHYLGALIMHAASYVQYCLITNTKVQISSLWQAASFWPAFIGLTERRTTYYMCLR